jgi:hypothetical protein
VRHRRLKMRLGDPHQEAGDELRGGKTAEGDRRVGEDREEEDDDRAPRLLDLNDEPNSFVNLCTSLAFIFPEGLNQIDSTLIKISEFYEFLKKIILKKFQKLKKNQKLVKNYLLSFSFILKPFFTLLSWISVVPWPLYFLKV